MRFRNAFAVASGCAALAACASGSGPLDDLVARVEQASAPPSTPVVASVPDDEGAHVRRFEWITGPPEPRDDCEAALAAAGVRTGKASLPVRAIPKSDRVCGAEQVVVYRGSPAKIRWEPAPVVTCGMALALARFDAIAQEEAERALGSRVVAIKHLGSYACRGMAKFPGWPSEHSYANAIDVSTFVLKNGKEITVRRDFEATEEPPTKKAGDFLRRLSERAYGEEVFSSVLTPYFNALHRDHFHLDLARYRINGAHPRYLN